MLPPSPALSECDSLDGIDDLDAFLAAKGQLSQWPTPPSLQKSPAVETFELNDAMEIDKDSPDFYHVATVLAEAASIELSYTPLDVETIRDMVFRAELPVEVIALALSILSGLQACAARFHDSPPDLLVVGALSLASSYTNDHAPRPFWWSHFICDCQWTAKRIDRTVLKLLTALDFSLHQFTSDVRMDQAMMRLSSETQPASCFEDDVPERQPLKLLIDSNTMRWEFGQLTPESTPPCSASPELKCMLPLMRFLPLL